MSQLVGHTSAKLDSKGRLTLPVMFKRQLAAEAKDTFIIKKDIFEKCLNLYPLDEWQQQVELLKKTLNPFNREHNLFMRLFFMDTAEISLDANNRLLLPKKLLEAVEIEKDVEIIGVGNKLELWAPHLLEQTQLNAQQFSELAQKILGNTKLDF